MDPYRGAGRPEATFLLERLVDVAAADMGLDPVEIRRRNFIPVDAFPYQTPVVQCYDSGDYNAALDKALALADYDGFGARAEEAKSRGMLRGIVFLCRSLWYRAVRCGWPARCRRRPVGECPGAL